MRCIRLCLVLVLGLLLAEPAGAATIRFKNGTQMRGTIVQRTATEVIVQLDFGTVSFAPDEIIAVEEEEPPAPTPTEPAPAASPPLPAPAAAAPATAAPPPSSEMLAVMSAVASIGVLKPDGTISVGNGTVINTTGVMVTNYHQVMDASSIAVMLPGQPNDAKPHKGRVIKSDPCYDLALIRIFAATPHYLRFADEKTIRPGIAVFTVGKPEGGAGSVSKGGISAVRRVKELVDLATLNFSNCSRLTPQELGEAQFIQTDAAITQANSGGPLLNARGEIVGLNAYGAFATGAAQGTRFALHAKHVREFVGAHAERAR